MGLSLISTGMWSSTENATVRMISFVEEENRSSIANGSVSTSEPTLSQQNNNGDGGFGETVFTTIILAVSIGGVVANFLVIVIIVCFMSAKNKVISIICFF